MSKPARPRLRLALSPYHVTTREAPAMAAALLADEVVTLRPTPLSGDDRDAVRSAVETCPAFARVLEAWWWSAPLWHAGVMVTADGADSLESRVRCVCDRMAESPRYRGLRDLMREGLFEDEGEYLQALCVDLLRGGADPSLSVPLAESIDAMAASVGATPVRLGGESLVQRVESKLWRQLFAIALPVLMRADGWTLLDARREFGAPLRELRGALVAAMRGDAEADLASASEAYTRAFDEAAELYVGHDDPTGERIVAGYVRIAGVALGPDAALRSSASALRMARSNKRNGSPLTGDEPGATPAQVSLVVTPMVAAPRRTAPDEAADVVL